jgi:predicted DNA-binding protein
MRAFFHAVGGSCLTIIPVTASAFIPLRVTPETKLRLRALAQRENQTESALLKQLLGVMLRSLGDDVLAEGKRDESGIRQARLTVRLQHSDSVLLRDRAAARAMPAATYVSVLVRAHLRSLTPLPKDELLALKRGIAELAFIGRNINQIAKVANDGGKLPVSVREEFRAMLRICEALRENTKALLKANLRSWSVGNSDSDY